MATGTNGQRDFPNPVPQSLVDDSRTITDLSIYNDSGLAAANLIGTLSITESATVKLGQAVQLPAGIITITVPTPTNGTALAAMEAVKGIIGTALYVIAHYQAPGTNRTLYRLTELGTAGDNK